MVIGMCLVLWQVSYLGLRVGEAMHPGPNVDGDMSIMTANVTSLLTQADVVCTLDADIIAVQES
eukprot:311871-Karenia_brevis.AAC.1